MARITAGEAIVRIMKAEGVRHVFGLPGGHILPLYDGIYWTEGIDHVLVRHEQAAACMAAANAQLTGQPGCCIVTAGPGATNLLTGVAEAWVGSLPMVIFAARGATTTAQKGASQEVPTELVFRPVTKWSIRCDRADQIPEIARRAFTLARSGKPGPVYVDLPRDLLVQEVDFEDYRPTTRPGRLAADPDGVAEAARLLIDAKRPVLIAGGGTIMSGAAAEVRALAEALAIPVLTSLAGRGILPDDHPLAAGGLGSHRTDLSRDLFKSADVILGLGTKFEEMETNWREPFMPDPSSKYIQVDIDPEEHGKSLIPAVALTGDAAQVARQLLEAIQDAGAALAEDGYRDHSRITTIRDALAVIEDEADRIASESRSPVHALTVIRAARKVFPRESVAGFDVGCLAQHIAGAFPYFRVFEPRTTVVPSSFYGMGFVAAGFPTAKLVYPDRPALCFVGDGSFQMIMANIICAVENHLPVTWIVLNDGAYGSIRDIQTYVYGERYLGTDLDVQPDFAAIAKANGCFGEKIEGSQDVEGALTHALEANTAGQPAVLDFIVGNDRMSQSTEFFPYFKGEMPGMTKKA